MKLIEAKYLIRSEGKNMELDLPGRLVGLMVFECILQFWCTS